MKNINALCAGAKPPAVMQSFTVHVTPAIGFLLYLFPSCNFIDRESKEKQDREA